MNVANGSEKARSGPRPRLARGRTVSLVLLAAVLIAGCVACQAVGSRGSATPAPGGHAQPRPAAPPSCPVSAILVPQGGAWWGMYVPSSPSGTGLGAAVARQETWLGRSLGIVERYHDMSTGEDGTFPNPAERDLGRSHLLLFSWAPVVWSAGTEYR